MAGAVVVLALGGALATEGGRDLLLGQSATELTAPGGAIGTQSKESGVTGSAAPNSGKTGGGKKELSLQNNMQQEN